MSNQVAGVFGSLGLAIIIIFSVMGGWMWMWHILRRYRKKPHPNHVLVNLRSSDTMTIDDVPFVIRSWDNDKRDSVIRLQGVDAHRQITKKSSARDIERSINNHYELNAFLVGETVEINDVLYVIESYDHTYYGEQKPMIVLRQWGSKPPSYSIYI